MPFQYYFPYRRPYNGYRHYNNYNNFNTPNSSPYPDPDLNKKTPPPKSDRTVSASPSPNNTVWFDLFGIKLYFDDVLILSLLFFLYKEDVKDEGLFLALIMLLIS